MSRPNVSPPHGVGVGCQTCSKVHHLPRRIDNQGTVFLALAFFLAVGVMVVKLNHFGKDGRTSNLRNNNDRDT